MGIEKQARGRLRLGTVAVVHRQLIGPTLDAFAATQIELTRRVVARMTGYTMQGKNRLYLSTEGHRLGRQ